VRTCRACASRELNWDWDWEWELRMENVWGDSIGTFGMGMFKGMGLRMDIELKCRMCLNSFT